MRTVFLDMKGPIMIDFPEKGATVNSTFSYCQLLSQNSPLFIEWNVHTHRYIYIYIYKDESKVLQYYDILFAFFFKLQEQQPSI